MQWASCQIRKIAVAHAPGMPGTFSPSPQVSDPDMHHGTCVTHVPWCMPGSLYSSFLWNWRRGKTFPAFPAHAQPVFLRIWQEAHCTVLQDDYQPHWAHKRWPGISLTIFAYNWVWHLRALPKMMWHFGQPLSLNSCLECHSSVPRHRSLVWHHDRNIFEDMNYWTTVNQIIQLNPFA